LNGTYFALESAIEVSMKERILAIEDDPEVLDLYVAFFERRGYQITAVRSASEAIKELEKHPDVKLILLDLNLPGMSGEEWMAWYVNRGSDAPVIVVSGKGEILSVTKGANFTAALTKPFHMEELQELVEVLLQEDWKSEVSDDTKTH
jgi:DNA-binding response OmpR family regulator